MSDPVREAPTPDDAREIARDLRTVAASVMARAPTLYDLMREAADAIDGLAAAVEAAGRE